MYKMLNRNLPGVTSLLFVLAIGMVLVVMVAGIAALTIREQQQASNTDLSNRALQTSESGVKIAVQKLIADPNYSKLTCAKEATDNYLSLTANNQEISCITVQSVFTNFDSYLKKDRTEQLFMGSAFSDSATSPSFIRIKWNNPSLGDVGSNFNYPGGLYPQANYANAATIELSLIYWKQDAKFNNIEIKKFLLAPGNNTNPADTIVNSICAGQSGAPADLTDYKCSTVNSGTAKGFDVKQAIGLPSSDSVSNYNFAIIVSSRYKDTHVQVTSYASDGSSLNMKSANAQIDSTARAGNLYRRVKASRSLGVSGALENVLDGAVYSGKGADDSVNLNICKNFTAIEDPVGSGNYKWTGTGTSPNCNNITL